MCQDYLSKGFPRLSGAPVIERRLCQYTSTSDSSCIEGAGSGHGFKHGPALRKYVSDLIEKRLNLSQNFPLMIVHTILVVGYIYTTGNIFDSLFQIYFTIFH